MKRIPVWIFFLLCRFILTLRYKIVYEGLENIDKNKGILLISNHTSWVDWLILQFPFQRQVHYIITKRIYNKPIVHTGLWLNNCIPISKKASKDAFIHAQKALEMKKIVGIFPEGSITKDAELKKFFPGFELLKKTKNAVIVPVYIHGLWGSKFSYAKEKSCTEKSGFRRVVRVHFANPLSMQTTAPEVKQAIAVMKEKA